MALKPKRREFTGGNGAKMVAPLLDADNYPARLVQVIDLGLHKNFFEEGKVNHQVMLTYELTTEFMEDETGEVLEDKPRWLSETFNIIDLPEGMTYEEILADQYRGKAKMVQRARAFDPKGKLDFDFSAMADMPCAVQVIQKPKNKKDKSPINAVGGVSAPMRGLTIDPLKNPPKVFVLDEPDAEVFGSLPDWLQERIKENLEYKGSALEALLNGGTPPNDPEPEGEEDDDTAW